MEAIDFPRPAVIREHQYSSECIVLGLGGMKEFDRGSGREHRAFVVELPCGEVKEVCAWLVTFTDRRKS